MSEEQKRKIKKREEHYLTPTGEAKPAQQPSPPGAGLSSTPRQAGWELRGDHAGDGVATSLPPEPYLRTVRRPGEPHTFFPSGFVVLLWRSRARLRRPPRRRRACTRPPDGCK